MAAADKAKEGKGRGSAVKGSVRPLADSISVKDAERAARQVREAIGQQQQQLNDLQRFSDENKSLSHLVQELPDSVSHGIMVPFGKAAFFPGRLIHTNEFLVLLGESHYAERSAKQTVEILHRRSEFLDRKIATAKAQIADLEAESSFVTNTAEEAKAGLVEIREEYLGSDDLQNNLTSTSRVTAPAASSQPNELLQVGHTADTIPSTSSSLSGTTVDHDHELLMARLTELELAEAAVGSDIENSDEEIYEESNAEVAMPFSSNLHTNEVARKEHDLVDKNYDGSEVTGEDENSDSDNEDYDNDDQRSSEEEEMSTEAGIDSGGQTWDKDMGESLRGKPLSRFASEVHSEKQALNSHHAQQKARFQQGNHVRQSTENQISSKKFEKPQTMHEFSDLQKELQEGRRDGEYRKDHLLGEGEGDEMKKDGSSMKENSRAQTFGETAAQLKAFTGKVTEHSYKEPTSSDDQQVQESQPSRPISKFKMRQAQGGRR